MKTNNKKSLKELRELIKDEVDFDIYFLLTLRAAQVPLLSGFGSRIDNPQIKEKCIELESRIKTLNEILDYIDTGSKKMLSSLLFGKRKE